MRLEELNFMDVEKYLQHDDRLMLVLGATEQHGYLSLLADVQIPQALADAASQRSGVLVAPPLNFGISPSFLDYPGTISLRTSTFMDAVEDIIRSVYRSGFRRLLILNGHGGNEPVRGRLVELANELPGLVVEWYSWWTAKSVTETAAKHGLQSYHAAWIEAFRFTRVSPLPQGEKPPVVTHHVMGAEETRRVVGDGVYGGPYQAPDEIMDEIFDAALRDVLNLIKFP